MEVWLTKDICVVTKGTCVVIKGTCGVTKGICGVTKGICGVTVGRCGVTSFAFSGRCGQLRDHGVKVYRDTTKGRYIVVTVTERKHGLPNDMV